MVDEQLLDIRKFALQMAIGPAIADEDPMSICFGSIVDAAQCYANFLLNGTNTGHSPDDEGEPVNLNLVQ